MGSTESGKGVSSATSESGAAARPATADGARAQRRGDTRRSKGAARGDVERRARSTRQPSTPRRVVRRHATVRRIDPWSVLKLSLIFYFCTLLVVMVGITLFWAIVNELGLVQTVLRTLEEFRLSVTINGANIARVIFLLGLVNVILWSGINVFLAFLYNLVADVLGGLRVTLAEED